MSCRLSLAISVGRVMGGAPSFEYKTSLKTPKNRVDDDFDILFEKESPLGMERYEEEIKRQNIWKTL